MEQVYNIKCESYDVDDVNECVKRHFEYLNLSSKIPKNSGVFIKLNLLMKSSPESATITHPSVVRSVVRNLKAIGITDITIGDSPGGPFTVGALKSVYTAAGLVKVAEEEEVLLNYNTASTTVDTPSDISSHTRSFDVIDAVLNADYVINICKLKTHGMMTMSGAVKNMFGVIPGLTKPEYHMRFPETQDFADMLVDLSRTVKQDITFVDAVYAMEGDGPSGGEPRFVGRILSGTNPYDMDVVLCHIMGLEPENVPTVKKSVEKGLCSGILDEVEVIGDELERISDFKMPGSVRSVVFEDYVPKILRKPFRTVSSALLKPKPLINTPKCIGCGKCAESCPAKTIAIKDKKAEIDYKNCIKCYCCHEMCPVRAIDFKRSFLTRTRG